MFANEIRPYQCHADHRRQTCDAVDVTQVGVLDVESGGLHGAKACLNLPALFVGCHGSFRTIVANQDLQLRHTVGVFQHGTCNVDIFHKVYWLVRFNSKDYTVLSSDCEPVAKEHSTRIHNLLLNHEFYNYIDLAKEQERQIRLAYVRGIILCLALNQKAKDRDTVRKMIESMGISIDEFEQVRINDIEYVTKNYPLEIVNNDSKVAFFSYLLSNYVFVETITSTIYQSLIDNEFLKEICEIQGGLELTDIEQEQALRLLKISHSAIINAIQPDKFIINSIKNISQYNNLNQDKVRELGVTKLMGLLIEGANDDFCTQPYSKILHELGIYQYEILQRIILNNGKNDEVRIESNPKTILAKAENLPGKPVLSVMSFNNESDIASE